MKPADILTRIRHLREDMAGLLVQLRPEDLSEGETPDLVTLGWELWRIIDVAHKTIEPVKQVVRLRAEATGKRGHVNFTGSYRTTCQVTVPDPVPKLRKDADLDDLRRVLGDKFGDLFAEQVQVQPRPKFETLVAALTPEEREAVLNAVDLAAGTSRVSFE